ncbi:MAG: hypothetical protein QM520_00470 [Gammaproteobacteria bacterium]|nr:hypothetical protein [Gammaproteobacteria bacterium]
MAFVNAYISPEDRERYRLAEFEKQFWYLPPNPGPSWAIDRERDIFLRIIHPAARKFEPGDPEAVYEKDFQFHWQGYDYFVSTSRKDTRELDAIPLDAFVSNNPHPEGARVLRFLLLHIGEIGKPSPEAPSALRTQRQQVLSDLEFLLAFGEGGVFAGLTKEQTAEPRYAIMKISPRAEVIA